MTGSNQRIVRILLLGLLVAHTSFGLSDGFAQSSASDREAGISLYEKKDYQQAGPALQRAVRIQKNDLTSWHYLGLTLEQLGLAPEAGKAHKKAANLGSSLVMAAMKEGDWITAFRPDSSQIIQAAASADRYLKLFNPRGSEGDEWTEKSRSLRELAEIASTPNDILSKLYLGKEVSSKARVLEVPPPAYGSEDRARPITVVLRGVLSADGRVRGVMPLESDDYQGYGLSCIKAARRIKFTPALKDGKAVSSYMEFQYSRR
jgi:tetratricopeptide (TPR) repeat protein